ncbi:unnamed protein product [Lactuca virosa]|uniref:Uncharacterized protein n=1 Tax=Lactuca virosa TaxID=75947 RepID=A0AAU9N832_9ASTR|nr:unnamed protein product [Lactuca virosa]
MFFDLLHTSSSLPVLASTFTHLGIPVVYNRSPSPVAEYLTYEARHLQSIRSSPPSSSSSTTERNPSQNSVVVLAMFPIITSSFSNMALYMGNQGHGIATKYTSKIPKPWIGAKSSNKERVFIHRKLAHLVHIAGGGSKFPNSPLDVPLVIGYAPLRHKLNILIMLLSYCYLMIFVIFVD